MKEQVIYIAGDPDAFPIEYYDKKQEDYQGVVPALLQQFSQETDYEVQYYAPGKKDQRKQLAMDRQVDMISNCKDELKFHHNKEDEVLTFVIEQDGETVEYQLVVLENAPGSLRNDLETFFSQVTAEEKNGLILQNVKQIQNTEKKGIEWLVVLVGILFFLLLFGVSLLVRKYKKKIVSMEQEREVDEITGIGNGDHLIRYYRSVLNDRNRVLYAMFYFYIDIERIEKVTERKSRDLFLRHMAAVLQEYAADTDILAKVADGGFALFHQTLDMEETLAWLEPALERIHTFTDDEALAEIYQVSAGIYFLRADDKDLNEILFNAAQTAQAAYREGKRYQVCTNELLHVFLEERKLQGQIRRGLENQEFELYIQFYVDAKSYQIVGGEALSRWNHPERGMLGAGNFIPLMEKEGIVSLLDYYSLEKACFFLERLGKMGISDFFVSCNFSRGTFSEKNFAFKCEEIISKYTFDRHLLVVEITESTVEKNPVLVRQNIGAIKELGVRLALDDFGDGFTSFLDIQDFPLDGLKLDKGLIDNIGTNPGDIIIRAMIEVGHQLGITVLGEGVEEEGQVYALQEMGCDVIQGFYFHYPIPEWEAIHKLLEKCHKETTNEE